MCNISQKKKNGNKMKKEPKKEIKYKRKRIYGYAMYNVVCIRVSPANNKEYYMRSILHEQISSYFFSYFTSCFPLLFGKYLLVHFEKWSKMNRVGRLPQVEECYSIEYQQIIITKA